MSQKGCTNLIREWPPFTLSVINTNTLMILVQHTLFQRILAVFEILMSKTHHRETRKYWAVCCHNNDHIVRGVASPDCPGGGGKVGELSRWRVSANCTLARTGGCLRGMCPPQKLEDFGILILNSRNLVITFTQNSFH